MLVYNKLYLFIFIFSLLLSVGCNQGNSTEPPTENQDGILFTVAGISGAPGSAGNGGLAVNANLNLPLDGFITPDHKICIVDWSNNCIRIIDTLGVINRFIGSGNPGDDPSGSASLVNLNHPSGIIYDLNGKIWLASWQNSKIQSIDPTSMMLSSPFGSTPGFEGDGGPANLAKFNLPNSIVFDEDGNMLISDQANQRIRMIDTFFNISTIAGGGQKGFTDGFGDSVKFNFPSTSDVIPGGKICWGHHPDGIFIADTDNNRIRFLELYSGEVYTIAGTGQAGYSGDGGLAKFAVLNHPTDIYQSDDHFIYFTDSYNHVIRKINPLGIIETVVGNGTRGYSPSGTPAKLSMLNTPGGIFYDEDSHTLYIADTYNHQIKKVQNP